jgi:hypothetical protein
VKEERAEGWSQSFGSRLSGTRIYRKKVWYYAAESCQKDSVEGLHYGDALRHFGSLGLLLALGLLEW